MNELKSRKEMKVENEFRKLKELTGGIKKEIEEWLGEEIRIGQLDQARLLRLRVWKVRYKVEIAEILDLVIPVLRSRLSESTRKRMRGSLQVTIPMLTGNGAERVLTEELQKRYEAEENYVEWKENEKQKQVERERSEEFEGLQPRSRTKGKSVSVLQSVSVEEFAKEYETQMLTERREHQRHSSERWRKRKAYRYSPWR